MTRTKMIGATCVLAFLSYGASAVCGGADPAVRQLETDLLIVGGTESGWAAAIQAARQGVASITIVHDGTWLGGQFTEQALACVDENKGVGRVGWGVDWHPMKRSFHRTGLFREFMDRIESVNLHKYGSTMPGKPFHGPSTFRPFEAEQVFRGMLQPYIDSGRIHWIPDHYAVKAAMDVTGPYPRVTHVSFAPLNSTTADLHVAAGMTIDASDWGDVIQVCGADYECGPDPQARYNEPSAPPDLTDNPPNEMNPITWAMIVEQADGHAPIEQPARFDNRCFPRATNISRGELSDLEWDQPVRAGGIPHWPDAGKEASRQLSVLTVRRIVDGTTAQTGQTVALMNYMLGQDYPLERLPQHVVDALEQTEQGASEKNIVRMTRQQRQIIYDDAKRHSLCLLYHMQNFVHQRAADKTNSLRNYRLSDEFGTVDRLPHKPYIRESLRLKAMYMMREQDGRNSDGPTKEAARERFARVLYPDGIFCWQFHYDFHNTGRAYLVSEGNTGPWVDYEKPGRHTHHVSDRSLFPARSLVPRHVDGLLGAQKNLGYSSIVCAAIRLHDQCITVGQAAGAMAAVSLAENITPRQITQQRQLVEQIRGQLCGGTPGSTPLQLFPYRDLDPNHSAFVAINRLAANGSLPYETYEVDFQPDAPATPEWITAVKLLIAEQYQQTAPLQAALRHINSQTAANSEMTRGQICTVCWEQLKSLPLKPWIRRNDTDADQDGIDDANDPTPFHAAPPIEWHLNPPSPQADGLPDAALGYPGLPDEPSLETVAWYNFGGRGNEPVKGMISDHGDVFDLQRGFGWDGPMSENARRRHVYPEAFRDSFLFTRNQAVWDCAVADGTWLVTVCIGDAGHEQPGQQISLEGQPVVTDLFTAAGQFHEVSTHVEVIDGRLTVQLGPQASGCNTCLNWIRVQRMEEPIRR